MLRKTKILATLGPASDDSATINALLRAGASIFRLNMSHAQPDWTRRTVDLIRAAAHDQGVEAAVLIDLRGPSIRTGDVSQPIDLAPGDLLELRLRPEVEAERERSVTVNYPGLGRDVRPGDPLLLANGLLRGSVVAAGEDRVVVEMKTGGQLTSRRHINLPGVSVGLPTLSRKDHADIDLAVSVGADFVALSFARHAAGIEELRALLQERGSKARVVAKIENHQAMANLDSIIEVSDAVMVARGDLGVECEIEELPIIQRRIIERCSFIGRKCIVATQMLESMVENPVPTRAEVTDVFNAVMEQVDCVMLSGETAAGRHPVACVEVLDRVARRVEAEFPAGRLVANPPLLSDKHRTSHAANTLANSIAGCRILVFTLRGVLGHLIAHQRPERAPIFAFSPNLDVVRSLLMARSVHPFSLSFDDEPECIIENGIRVLRDAGLLASGDPLVIISDVFHDAFEVDSILWRKA